MGYYSGNLNLEFEGTKSEKQMMENLLQIMEPDSDKRWSLPVNEHYDYYPVTALLGVLHKQDDSKYNIAFRDIAPLLAPILFAALFPASRFRYSIELEYSVTSEGTQYITAVYDDKTLKIREAILNNDYDEDKIEKICRKQLKTDPDAKRNYDQYCEEFDIEEEKDIDWFELLDQLVDNPEETMASLYKFKKRTPSRNTKYEKSFFNDGDLHEYLISEQIKRLDMSLAEYIKAFTFTKKQFLRFIQVAEDCHFSEMMAFLEKEKEQRFAAIDGSKGTSQERPEYSLHAHTDL